MTVAIVKSQGRIVAIFPRSYPAIMFARQVPWGREVHHLEAEEAMRQMLEQDPR